VSLQRKGHPGGRDCGKLGKKAGEEIVYSIEKKEGELHSARKVKKGDSTS